MDDRTTIAAMALHGLLAGNAGEGYSYAENLDSLPRSAVDYADRLVLELKKGSPAPAQEEALPPEPTGQDAGEVVCKCGDPKAVHSGGATFCTNPECWCLKFQPAEQSKSLGDGSDAPSAAGDAPPAEALHEHRLGKPEDAGVVASSPCSEPKDSQEDPELRDQVASVEGSVTSEGPAHAPEQHREAGVQRHAGSEMPGDGATASPAAAKWGRVKDPDAAWHLWEFEGAGEAACGEATDAEIEFLPANTGMDPEQVCLDCKDIDVQAHLAAAPAIHARPLPSKPRCAGFNKSASVPCNTKHVHFERDGKHYCKRHDPLKPKKARPAQEAAA